MANTEDKTNSPPELFGPDPLVGLPATDYRLSRVRRRRSSGTARISLNLTAMIDVVFLLLIYFMAGTSFKLGEEIYRMDLPERGPSNALRDPFELDDEPLRISIASVGRTGDSYRIRLDGPYEQLFLSDLQIGQFTTRGMFEADHPIIIEPARTARWEHAVGVFNAAARARYTNITFAKPGG